MEYKTLDSFITKFNFTNGRLGSRIGVTREIVRQWRSGIGKPSKKNLEELRKVVSEYIKQDAAEFFPYKKSV